MGYKGPIGLQCFGIGGDAREHLARSMTAWRKLSLPLAAAGDHPQRRVLVGNLCPATAPNGIAMIVDDRAGFVVEPEWSERPKDNAQVPPGTTAPDGSIS